MNTPQTDTLQQILTELRQIKRQIAGSVAFGVVIGGIILIIINSVF